jgi:ribonucleoside-diphosphate reductase alpha chain
MQHQEVGSVGAAAGFAAVAQSVSAAVPVTAGGAMATSLADYKLIRRNGAVVAFEPGKIAVAMTKAFLAVRGGQGAASAAVREQVERLRWCDASRRAALCTSRRCRIRSSWR